MDLTPEHRLREARRMRVHRRDDLIGCLLSLVIPGAARSEIVAEVLTEQARDMAALRREHRLVVIDGGSVWEAGARWAPWVDTAVVVCDSREAGGDEWAAAWDRLEEGGTHVLGIIESFV